MCFPKNRMERRFSALRDVLESADGIKVKWVFIGTLDLKGRLYSQPYLGIYSSAQKAQHIARTIAETDKLNYHWYITVQWSDCLRPYYAIKLKHGFCILDEIATPRVKQVCQDIEQITESIRANA